MNTQVHQAFAIAAGRAWSDPDPAVLREVELARETARSARRARRIFSR